MFEDFIRIISIRKNHWWGHTMPQSKVMASYVSWQWFLGFHTHSDGDFAFGSKKREFWWGQRLPWGSAEKFLSDYYHPICVFEDFIRIISIHENHWWGHTMSQSKVMASYVSWQWFLCFHTHSEGFFWGWNVSEKSISGATFSLHMALKIFLCK